MPKLGVNVDHVATVRQARGGIEPDPVKAMLICEKAGCDSIVAHLREDRRHINDRDVFLLKKVVRTRFNLEMSINKEIVDIACRLRPHQATLVPEKRLELTTEGGLSVIKFHKRIKSVIERLICKGIEVSIFIDPDRYEIQACKDIGAEIIEIHTGQYSLAHRKSSLQREYDKIYEAALFADSIGLVVNAGHGLNYANVQKIAEIPCMNELNIGHSIISRAVFVGLERAVREMKELIS